MKTFTKIIKTLFDVKKRETDPIDYKIRCKHCGEVVSVKVFPDRDLNATYNEEGPAYTLRKEVMGSKCYKMMVLTAEFDKSRREISKDIFGGEFVED